MNELLSESIERLIENGSVKDLIPLPGEVFNLAFEVIRRKRAEAQGFRYLDPHNPATCDSCEG
jgi:hypothetical protein